MPKNGKIQISRGNPTALTIATSLILLISTACLDLGGKSNSGFKSYLATKRFAEESAAGSAGGKPQPEDPDGSVAPATTQPKWPGTASLTIKDGAQAAVTFNPVQSYFALATSISGFDNLGIQLTSPEMPTDTFTKQQPCSTGGTAPKCKDGDISMAISICTNSSVSCSNPPPSPLSSKLSINLSVAAGGQPTYPVSSISLSVCKSGAFETFLLDTGTLDTSNPTSPKFTFARQGTVELIPPFSKAAGGNFSVKFTDVKLMTLDKSKTRLISGEVTGGATFVPLACK